MSSAVSGISSLVDLNSTDLGDGWPPSSWQDLHREEAVSSPLLDGLQRLHVQCWQLSVGVLVLAKAVRNLVVNLSASQLVVAGEKFWDLLNPTISSTRRMLTPFANATRYF